MAAPLAAVARMEYPGRLIIIGCNPVGARVVMYAITGRSPSSQARRLELGSDATSVFVKPTDEETLKTGQPDLLVYSALICGKGIAVSNGKQTDDVAAQLGEQKDPVDVLVKGLAKWTYEPDEPNFTPRISGCITGKGAALAIQKRAADGSLARAFHDIPLIAGTGKLLSTYTGANGKPLPSFAGEPVDVDLPWTDPAEGVAALYEALGPKEGGPDYRVSSVCAITAAEGKVRIKVRNRHG